MTIKIELFKDFWRATTDLVEGEKLCRARAQAIEDLIGRAQDLRRKIDHLPIGNQAEAELYLEEVERGLDDDQEGLAIIESRLAEIRKKREQLRAEVWEISRDEVLGGVASMR